MKQQSYNFTEGKILGPLLRFVLPVLLALFLQALYGAVDLLVVGKFAGAEDVSAVSTGSQIMMTITNIVSSMAMGVTVFLAQKVGERDAEAGGRIVGAGVCLFVAIGAVLTCAIPLLSGVLARTMQAPMEAFALTVGYIRICGFGAIVIILYNLIGSIFRGLVDSRTPLVTVMIACACNVIGDLLLVAGFGMGARGAALAPVFAQFISVVISLLLIRKKELPFAFSLRTIRPNGRLMGKIVTLGAPHCAAGFAGGHLLPGDSGHRQRPGPGGLRRRGRGGKGVRLHHAGAGGIYAGHVRLRGTESWRRQAAPGRAGPQLRCGGVGGVRRGHVCAELFPGRHSIVCVRQR